MTTSRRSVYVLVYSRPLAPCILLFHRKNTLFYRFLLPLYSVQSLWKNKRNIKEIIINKMQCWPCKFAGHKPPIFLSTFLLTSYLYMAIFIQKYAVDKYNICIKILTHVSVYPTGWVLLFSASLWMCLDEGVWIYRLI